MKTNDYANGTTMVVVCVGNYGSYNQGYLLDQWFDLPMEPKELQRRLGAMQAEAERLTGAPCEEFYVSDYDSYPLDRGAGEARDLFTENTPIDSLNLMAMQLATMDGESIDAAAAYIDHNGSTLTMDEAMNVLLQADEVPYHDYGWGEYQGSDPVYQAIHDNAPREEKYGYLCVDANPELKKLLEEDTLIESAFDYEEYGRQCALADGAELLEDGYLADEEINMSYYDHAEIAHAVCDNLIRSGNQKLEGIAKQMPKSAICEDGELVLFPAPDMFEARQEQHGSENVSVYDYRWDAEKSPLRVQIAQSSVTDDFTYQVLLNDDYLRSGIENTFEQAYRSVHDVAQDYFTSAHWIANPKDPESLEAAMEPGSLKAGTVKAPEPARNQAPPNAIGANVQQQTLYRGGAR